MSLSYGIAQPVKSTEKVFSSFSVQEDIQFYDLDQEEAIQDDDLEQVQDDDVPRKKTSTSVKREWYGYKIWLAELGNLIFPGITYLIGGPIVHFMEREVKKGFASLGLRVFLPIIGGFVLYQLCLDCDTDGMARLGAVVGGGLLGILGAVVIDASILAYKEVPELRTPLSIFDQLHEGRPLEVRSIPHPWLLKWNIRF